MPRKSKKSSTLNTNREQEILNKTIDTAGNDPNPVVNALMSEEFIQASNLDASQIALMLQEIVRGQNSLIAMAKENSDEIIKLKERQEQIDRDAEARHAAQKNEIADVLNRAEKLKAKGDKKDRLIAKGVNQYQKAVQNARASKTVDRLVFEKKLAAEPQEYVVASGKLITTIESGRQVAKILPEEIRIKHKVWYLQPGVPTKVPHL